MVAPPRDHPVCDLGDCLSSSRSAVPVPVLVDELTAGQVGTGSAWKLYMCCAAATRVSGTRVVFAIPLSGNVLVVSPGDRVAGCSAFNCGVNMFIAPVERNILQLSVTGGESMRLYAGQFEYCTRWKSAFTTLPGRGLLG